MQKQTHWYENFFHGVALDLWRKAISPERTRMEVKFMLEVLNPSPGCKILDVPCGHGRHALELASIGYRVTGLDISEESIHLARSQAQEKGLKVEFCLAEMREIPWESEFDAAYCVGNSFGYLEHEGTLEFLNKLSRSLKPGARFLLETGMAAETMLSHHETRTWFQIADILLLIEHRYNPEESHVDTDYIFVKKGKVEIRQAFNVIYTIGEIRRLLASVGLQTAAIYGNTEREPFTLGMPHVYFVAEKTG
jgi:2-polyprenyl-3-methyl-5-hydroxy-6-metoxy-1,4-benzoquinol methylase